jgi:hypothetical protein
LRLRRLAAAVEIEADHHDDAIGALIGNAAKSLRAAVEAADVPEE